MSSSLYAKYVKERLGDEIIETEYGFATFRYIDKHNSRAVYIVDIYILPEYRNLGEATRLADRIAAIANVSGCNEMIGTVLTSAKTATDSIKVLLAYGMTLKSSTSEALIFVKAI
jgi:ribosomal protein S18 acetylase RimI-like enzyme